MPVKEISGVKFVIRLPDQDTLSEAAKKFLVQEMRPNINDGEIWIKPVWSDINSELHQLQQLGFNGEDHNDPDVYLYSSDNPYPEIPWALRTPVKYIDDKEPEMQILWVNKESTNLTFENRPFHLATEEEYAAWMDWPTNKNKFWRFTIRYNVILLGALYLLLLVLTIIVMKFRMEGVIHAQLLLCLFLTLLVALISWPVCVIKTWRRTKFDRKFRVLAMAYLFGAPVVLLFVTSVILRLTAKLMMP